MTQAATGAVHLTQRQKAALVLLTLDMDTAAFLMQGCSQGEIENLAVEISAIKHVPSAVIEQVLTEFLRSLTSQDFIVQGGIDEARKLIARSLGSPKADEILEKLTNIASGKGFEKLRRADGKQLARLLQEEHPQTIALIISNLPPEKAAEVLGEFSPEVRNDVTLRIATLGTVSPALLVEMEKVVETIAAAEIAHEARPQGGTKSVATVLNNCATDTAKAVLDHIQEKNSNLATEIKRLMFVFEDLVKIDDRGIQRVLRDVDKKDLAMALKVVEENLKEKIYMNMSERARDLLKEELQYMGPVRLKEVEAAQMRILEAVKQLEEQGEVVISGRGGKEDVVV